MSDTMKKIVGTGLIVFGAFFAPVTMGASLVFAMKLVGSPLRSEPTSRRRSSKPNDAYARMCAAFPAMRSPPPPVPARFVRASTFPLADIRKRIEAGTFRLRAPLRTQEGDGTMTVQALCARDGVFASRLAGTCLAGIIDAGDALFLDPREPADDGDFVLVLPDRDRPGEFSDEDADFVVKLLVHNEGTHLLCAYNDKGAPHESSILLGRHRIIAVVRGVARVDSNGDGDMLYVD